MVATTDERWMRRALELAAYGTWPDPNPRVGCVIVGPDGALVAESFHRGAGTPHAEVEALAMAGARARGSTVFVTLEPCAHTGRTGPCADALVDAGVSAVVFAQEEPNPRAAGGAAALRRAGVAVTGGRCQADAARLNERWTRTIRLGRPIVTWKFAATLDGRSAALDGTSQWVTGPAARADVHRLRATRDAVLVGTGTVSADDPRLTVRDRAGRPVERQPLRVVMGLRPLPSDARVLTGPGPARRLRTRDPDAALTQLWENGIRDVWFEGGPTLAAAFVRSGLVDEIYAYLAPALLGAGSPAVGDLGITTMAGIARLSTLDVRRLGPDVRIHAAVGAASDKE